MDPSGSWIAPATHFRRSGVANDNDPLLTNGDALAVEAPTRNIDLSVLSPPATSVPAPNTDEVFNPGQNHRVSGCVLRSTLIQPFTQRRSSMPSWISLIKPLPPAGENVITLRRDNHLALEIILAHLPRESSEEWDGIKVP